MRRVEVYLFYRDILLLSTQCLTCMLLLVARHLEVSGRVEVRVVPYRSTPSSLTEAHPCNSLLGPGTVPYGRFEAVCLAGTDFVVI